MLYTRENDALPKTIAGKENAKAYFTTLTMDLSGLTMNLSSVKRDIISLQALAGICLFLYICSNEK